MTPPRSHRLSLLAAILLFLLPPALQAQDLRYLHHQSWSTEDGLPQNSVHAILQSADGFLWIATEAGLARFDGLAFQTYSHANTPAFASDDICCLANAPSGDLWIGTADGTVVLHNQTFTRTAPQSAPGLTPAPDEGSIHGSQGTLWTYSKTAVTLTTPTLRRQWTAVQGLPGSRIETLFIDRAGTAWVGTNDGLATLTAGSPLATPIPALRGNVILSIYEDREGNLWIGSETSGLHLLNPVKFRTEPALAEKALTALIPGTDGSLWFGTRQDGLLRLSPDGRLDIPTRPEALTSPIILSLAAGLQGAVWAGTPDGLNLITPSGHVTRITSMDGLPDDYIQALLAAPDGSLWIGTRRGLAHLREGKITVLTQAEGLGGDLIGTLLLSSAHVLWIGNSGGLSRLSLAQPGLPITTVAMPNIVTALAEDSSGALWIATRGGALTRLADGRAITLPPPAPGAEIAALTPDTHGFLWLRTTQGIDRIALSGLTRCADATPACIPAVTRYTTADGLPSVELASSGSPVLLTLPTGELWSTTRRGAAITDPDHLPLNAAPPLLALERFLVDDAPIATATGQIDLPYSHTRFTMEYAALSFTAPSEVRYRYRLEPFDPTWTEAGSRRSATYTNLPPGTYSFLVQATNNDGLASPPASLLTFRIIPPIYRRWWFLTLAVLALAALAVTLYRLRLRRIQSRFDAVLNERNRLAREIHDTLAQDFVGVSIQLDLTAQFLSLNLIPAALDQVHAARKLVTDGLADARQSIWGLRANLAQDSLPTRLSKVVERYSTPSLVIRTRIGGAFRTLDASLENEVLRIAQESLSNVQRHSHATEASIDLRYGGDMLVLTVADNGQGFSAQEAATRTGHYGLGGMKERAETIGATLDIVSAPSAGTRITLSAPIPGAQQGREAGEE